MELGLTFPLQRFLKQRPPDHGTQPDRRRCWDLHVIELQGCKSMLAVHCHSRYAFVLYDLSRPEWEDLSGTFSNGLRRSLAAAGLPEKAAAEYLCRSGPIRLTRTHGRREVAFLNRVWEDVMALDHTLDLSAREQPLLDHAVNAKPSRCAGSDGAAPAAQRIGQALLG